MAPAGTVRGPLTSPEQFMSTKFLIPLCAAALLAACGPRDDTGAGETTTPGTTDSAGGAAGDSANDTSSVPGTPSTPATPPDDTAPADTPPADTAPADTAPATPPGE